MRILAFSGYRYTERAGDTHILAAPPFDQIGEAQRDELQASSPYQFAHLTRALPGPENDAHQHAKAVHDRWLQEGAVARDSEPTLYPYKIDRAGGSVRHGLCCLVGVGPSSEGDLRPHELTVDKPLADRLALLETTRVDLEPVMYIAEDDGTLEQMLEQDCQSDPVAQYLDGFGDRHTLYRLTDRSRIAAYQSLLAEKSAVIADGHHRTKVSQMFARKHEPAEGTAACAKMAVLFSLASSDLQIDPIHRAVRVPVAESALRPLAKACRPFEATGSGDPGAQLARAVAAEPQPAIGVWFKGGSPEIWQLDKTTAPTETPGNDTGLAAVLLHYQLLAAAGLPIESSTDGSIHYKSNPNDLYEAAGGDEYELCVWLPPMDPADFAKATEGGDVLPPKSTRFLPKLISGLVWSGHDGSVL